MNTKLPKPIQIFYAGDHTSSTGAAVAVAESELERAVQLFNQSNGLLPLVAGHPREDGPAYGYGTKLELQNGRVQVMEVRNLDPVFQAIVNSGELNNVSVKLRLAGHPENRTGVPEFRHVGFLGRSLPALDQLSEAAFAAANPHEVIVMTTQAAAAPATSHDAEFKAATAALEAKEAEFARQKAGFEAKQAEFKRAQAIEPEIEALVREGKVLPAEKPGFVALFSRLPEDFEVEFAAADGAKKVRGGVFLKDFLKNLKPRVQYSEISAASATAPESTEPEFSAPKGYTVSPEAAALHSKALAYCAANNLDSRKTPDYGKALKAVGVK